MTVSELINILKTFPQDYEVLNICEEDNPMTEGNPICKVYSVTSSYPDNNAVYIEHC